MRTRIGAQAFAIAALIIGLVVGNTQKKSDKWIQFPKISNLDCIEIEMRTLWMKGNYFICHKSRLYANKNWINPLSGRPTTFSVSFQSCEKRKDDIFVPHQVAHRQNNNKKIRKKLNSNRNRCGRSGMCALFGRPASECVYVCVCTKKQMRAKMYN